MHYHGTPITPRSVLHELAGRSFCVSFADPRDIEICHEIGQSVMLDNGAFTFWKQGGAPDWPGYYAWCEKWLEHWTTWAVIPDVIDGDEEANDALIVEWPFGKRGAPVWHMGESLERLARLVAEWPLVCVGSSGAYATLDTPAWRRRMAETLDTACDGDGRPVTRLHMLRGLGYSGGPYPFFSADSTNVARNHSGSHRMRPRNAGPMAAEIDARQTPARWLRPAIQGELTYAA